MPKSSFRSREQSGPFENRYAVVTEQGYIGSVHAPSFSMARDRALYAYAAHLSGKDFFIAKFVQQTIDRILEHNK